MSTDILQNLVSYIFYINSFLNNLQKHNVTRIPVSECKIIVSTYFMQIYLNSNSSKYSSVVLEIVINCLFFCDKSKN